MIHTIMLHLKAFTGWMKIPDICEFSEKFYDVHDYYNHKGGDGKPAHFYTYTCWNCGKMFTI